jgi:hypothetical protein
MNKLRQFLGEEVADPQEGMIQSLVNNSFTACTSTNTFAEAFLVFSQQIPSQNLGFVDSRASTLELNIAGKDITIHQSPGLLASNRKEGTTGAGTASSHEKFHMQTEV